MGEQGIVEDVAGMGPVCSFDATTHLGNHEGREAALGPHSTAVHILVDTL